MFMGPFDEGGDWNDHGINGISRFIGKIWKFCQIPDCLDEMNKEDVQNLHKTIKSVSHDLNQMKIK